MCRDSEKLGGPDPGFTQRATIDSDLGEFYVLSGIQREFDPIKPPSARPVETVKNSLWVYNIAMNKWYCAYENANSDPEYWRKMEHLEPCPRYAHQVTLTLLAIFITRSLVRPV